jgi:hypothetical protein
MGFLPHHIRKKAHAMTFRSSWYGVKNIDLWAFYLIISGKKPML